MPKANTPAEPRPHTRISPYTGRPVPNIPQPAPTIMGGGGGAGDGAGIGDRDRHDIAGGAVGNQDAAEAAGILAMAVVPYVFSRAVQQARRNRAEA